MSGVYVVNDVPVEVISVATSGLDVDNVANKNFVVIGSSNTSSHAIVDTGSALTSTRIMYGEAVAKLIQKNGTEVLLWGNNIDRYGLMTGGLLIKLNWYEVSDWPNGSSKTMVRFSKTSDLYATYGESVIYKWDSTAEAFTWMQDARADGPNILLFEDGPLELLDGLHIVISSRSVDVDEDGPHMQKATPLSGNAFFTQYSIYHETITTNYSATLVESSECDAVALQYGGGKQSTKKYKPLTTAQGLRFLNQMRTVRFRNYAPEGVCTGVVPPVPDVGHIVDDSDDAEDRETGTFKLDGKESNYSLTNLIKRYDFWEDFADELSTVTLVFPCGTTENILQSGKIIGTSAVAPGPGKWGGVLTYGAPRIKSYAPRYTHVQYDAAEHTLTWQEQRVNSYILFNNFEPTGFTKGLPPFGMGGQLIYVP